MSYFRGEKKMRWSYQLRIEKLQAGEVDVSCSLHRTDGIRRKIFPKSGCRFHSSSAISNYIRHLIFFITQTIK